MLPSLYHGHSILNLKLLLKIRQHFFFFLAFLAFAARQITGAERLLCRLLYKLTQLSATTRHHTVNQQQLTTSTTAEPSESRWSRASEWDLKKSSNLELIWKKRLFLRKTTTVPPSDFRIHFINESFFTFYTKKEYGRRPLSHRKSHQKHSKVQMLPPDWQQESPLEA